MAPCVARRRCATLPQNCYCYYCSKPNRCDGAPAELPDVFRPMDSDSKLGWDTASLSADARSRSQISAAQPAHVT
jgi:hypothetical protein